ncbi:RNA polymerase sigma factor [Marinobacterium zhoushanense]|uniref:RNA polymerase sigma factor n=1 Tax=Marinobacterium zhoushanense TaxID=1679163 RepID=A0ABQ1KIU7_9GAMM|nr:sigma-70 family RNA polymerase sigma factor [Marinobacterium zhoushanense]GGC00708.1 RNA polymerase sigma factor [Marinobacterium zhoushanense]
MSAETRQPDSAAEFESHRRFLGGLAYRMLGSVAEAEDVVQDAYLRWHSTEQQDIDNTRAYLTTVVSRICLDRLKSARHQRETYIGPWLPEPLIELQEDISVEEELSRDASIALMLALERLSPLERAVFLLHDVFELEFDEISTTLSRSNAACRQLAKRARDNIRLERSRFQVEKRDSERLSEAFFHASRSGDTEVLSQLLADNAILRTDGGGRRISARRPIFGLDRINRFFAGIARKSGGINQPIWARRVLINGAPGWLTLEQDCLLQATGFAFRDGRIEEIYIVRNPKKLLHLTHLIPNR